MRDEKRLSRASVLRMELYLDVLEHLQREGCLHATSAEIGKPVGVSPEKVRQDLFRLGSEGKPRVGYDIDQLLRLIRSVFDLDVIKRTCLVGFGNLGRALAGSNIWNKAGFTLTAIFDRDPTVTGTQIGDLRVRSVAEMLGVVKTENILAGVIAVPVDAAQETAELMVIAGIRAIWNFAPIKLNIPDGIAVENQSLAWGLITLSHSMKSANR